MKNSILRILALASMLCILLCACNSDGGETDTTIAKPVTTTPLTAVEQLTSREKEVFDALVKVATSNFSAPASVRVLEIGDYDKNTWMNKQGEEDGPHTVVVRLQGENSANTYYRICTVAGEDKSDYGQSQIFFGAMYGDSYLTYKADVGDCEKLWDSYELVEDDEYDIGRINKALAEYWEDMGF